MATRHRDEKPGPVNRLGGTSASVECRRTLSQVPTMQSVTFGLAWAWLS